MWTTTGFAPPHHPPRLYSGIVSALPSSAPPSLASLEDADCPAWDYLSTAQEASVARVVAKRHGERYADGIRDDKDGRPPKGGRPRGA